MHDFENLVEFVEIDSSSDENQKSSQKTEKKSELISSEIHIDAKAILEPFEDENNNYTNDAIDFLLEALEKNYSNIKIFKTNAEKSLLEIEKKDISLNIENYIFIPLCTSYKSGKNNHFAAIIIDIKNEIIHYVDPAAQEKVPQAVDELAKNLNYEVKTYKIDLQENEKKGEFEYLRHCGAWVVEIFNEFAEIFGDEKNTIKIKEEIETNDKEIEKILLKIKERDIKIIRYAHEIKIKYILHLEKKFTDTSSYKKTSNNFEENLITPNEILNYLEKSIYIGESEEATAEAKDMKECFNKILKYYDKSVEDIENFFNRKDIINILNEKIFNFKQIILEIKKHFYLPMKITFETQYKMPYEKEPFVETHTWGYKNCENEVKISLDQLSKQNLYNISLKKPAKANCYKVNFENHDILNYKFIDHIVRKGFLSNLYFEGTKKIYEVKPIDKFLFFTSAQKLDINEKIPSEYGLKFHVCLPEDDESQYDLGWKIIALNLMKNDVNHFKIPFYGRKMSKSTYQEGKDITIYAAQNSDLCMKDWRGIIYQINLQLVQFGVKPGYKQQSDPKEKKIEYYIINSSYFSYRYKKQPVLDFLKEMKIPEIANQEKPKEKQHILQEGDTQQQLVENEINKEGNLHQIDNLFDLKENKSIKEGDSDEEYSDSFASPLIKQSGESPTENKTNGQEKGSKKSDCLLN